MKKILIIICLSFMPAAFAKEHLQYAKVLKVYDGDTVQLDLEDKPTPLRLVGIDCFETSQIYRAYKQAYENSLTIEEVNEKGLFAKNILEKILLQNNNEVYFKCTGVDTYKRLLGQLYTKDNKNINEMMLDTGCCPKYVFQKR